MTKDFWKGLAFWLRGWQHIFQHRRLITAAVMPFLIASGAAFSLAWLLWSYLPAWTQWVVTFMGLPAGNMHDLLYYPLLISGGLLVFISSLYTIYIFQAVVALPFNSYLADRTLSQLGKKPPGAGGFTLRMLRVSLIKAVALLFIGLFLFVFSFLPVFNMVAIAGAFMILAMDCMDYSLDILGFGVRRRLKYHAGHLLQWIGMATGLALTLFIPGLTLLAIPGAVVGAALLYKTEGDK